MQVLHCNTLHGRKIAVGALDVRMDLLRRPPPQLPKVLTFVKAHWMEWVKDHTTREHPKSAFNLDTKGS